MAAITIRNLPEAVHRALRMRFGDARAALGRRAHLTDSERSIFERDRTPSEPIRIE